jgi:hypothetical protein
MDEQFFTQKQLDDLTKTISDSYEEQGPGTAKFCAAWPNVEEALSALQGILAIVPGVSAFAGPAIGIVRAAGTAASKAVCAK